jgi:hypothetical protein
MSYLNSLRTPFRCALVAATVLGVPMTVAVAVEQVVPAGTVDGDGTPLAPGDSLINSGTISNAAGLTPVFVTPNPGNSAIGVDGNVASIINDGIITGETFLATIGASGRIGTLLNTGTITNTDAAGSAVGDLGGFDAFTNEGTLTAAGTGVYSEGDVGLFENSGIIEAGDGSGVLFLGNGAVGDFMNSGVITSEFQGWTPSPTPALSKANAGRPSALTRTSAPSSTRSVV